MPKYSFILPIYKVEKYLEKCIDSILSQNFQDFELILVDDGSPDRCPNICDEYQKKDSRITVIHKKNGGLCDARNAGLNIAKGKYILFVDPDDYISDNYLEVIENNIKDNDLLIFGFNNLYVNKLTNGYSQKMVLDQQKAMEYLLDDYKYCGYVWNKVFKNEIIKKYDLRFDITVTMSEDVLFSYQYIEKIKKVCLIDDNLIYYRQRKSSIISQKVRNVNAASLVKTYIYIIDNSTNPKVLQKAKVLYLKAYYKYKKYISVNDFNMDLIDNILKNDYKNFKNHDKKIIFMYKYVPFVRSVIYKFKDLIYKKYD